MAYCIRFHRDVSDRECFACEYTSRYAHPLNKKIHLLRCGYENYKYTNLNIHERINAKSWVSELYHPAYCNLIESVTADDLTEKVLINIRQQCDRETKLYRKNWKTNLRNQK